MTKAEAYMKKPLRPQPYLAPVEWAGSALLSGGGRINKINCEGLVPPYLVLQNHASFVDFPLAAKAMFPHMAGWVISVEEFIGRDLLLRGVGGIYKRKFTQDLSVVKHIFTMLTRYKKSCVIYPEARFSLAGINEDIDGALGKLAKKAGVPVVVLMLRGNFLRSPQWCKHPYRKVPISGDFIQIVSREEVKTLPAEEIQRRIEEAFVYDDYKWQFDNKIAISSPKRAHNIHRILYQCPVCGQEFEMNSEGTQLWCEHCGARWEMDIYGQMNCLTGEDSFRHVPDWYRWERENVRKQVEDGTYRFEDTASLRLLVSPQKGFRELGDVQLIHDENGFTMRGEFGGDEFSFHRSVSSMRSLHIEYGFKKKGIEKPMDGIDLATLHETYFVFPKNAKNVLTKLHFATEELYRHQANKKAENKL